MRYKLLFLNYWVIRTWNLVVYLWKNRYDHNAQVVRFLGIKSHTSPLAAELLTHMAISERAIHIKTERENGKITITYYGDF